MTVFFSTIFTLPIFALHMGQFGFVFRSLKSLSKSNSFSIFHPLEWDFRGVANVFGEVREAKLPTAIVAFYRSGFLFAFPFKTNSLFYFFKRVLPGANMKLEILVAIRPTAIVAINNRIFGAFSFSATDMNNNTWFHTGRHNMGFRPRRANPGFARNGPGSVKRHAPDWNNPEGR